MPSFVSKAHIELIDRVRRLFPTCDVLGHPGPEVNLGALAGLSGVALRADIFIVFGEHSAVVVEYQSEIHELEKSNERHNVDEIAGRDDLKRQLCAKLGLGLVEFWRHNHMDSDVVLKHRIIGAANNSWCDLGRLLNDSEDLREAWRCTGDTFFASQPWMCESGTFPERKLETTSVPFPSRPMTAAPTAFVSRPFGRKPKT